MSTDYNSIIPNKILFNLKEIEDIGIIKTDMAKKLVKKHQYSIHIFLLAFF